MLLRSTIHSTIRRMSPANRIGWCLFHRRACGDTLAIQVMHGRRRVMPWERGRQVQSAEPSPHQQLDQPPLVPIQSPSAAHAEFESARCGTFLGARAVRWGLAGRSLIGNAAKMRGSFAPKLRGTGPTFKCTGGCRSSLNVSTAIRFDDYTHTRRGNYVGVQFHRAINSQMFEAKRLSHGKQELHDNKQLRWMQQWQEREDLPWNDWLLKERLPDDSLHVKRTINETDGEALTGAARLKIQAEGSGGAQVASVAAARARGMVQEYHDKFDHYNAKALVNF